MAATLIRGSIRALWSLVELLPPGDKWSLNPLATVQSCYLIPVACSLGFFWQKNVEYITSNLFRVINESSRL